MNHHQQQQKAKQASGSSSSTRIIKAKLSSASTQLLLPTTQAQLLTTTTPRPRTLSSTSNHTYNHHKSPSSTCSSSISFNSATRSPPPLPLPPPNHELTNNRLPRLEKLHSHQSLSIPSSSTSNQTATTSTPTTAHIDRAPSSSPPTDTYDHARVNRKVKSSLSLCTHILKTDIESQILDLEISNASLLAINGALERTKVKQQTEIRKLKGKLTPRLAGAGEAGSTVSETGSTSSSSNTSTLLNQLLISPSVDDDTEDVDLDTLVSEDPQFMDIIKSIEALINQAQKAILSNSNPTVDCQSDGGLTTGTIKTKVLNPLQIELIRRNSILPPSVQEQEDDVE
ncbi:hypothetical protein PSHT_13199 [Puccinia striiformis]|uniref:Uncharacterized protein n=1 Tax=Puccinia striiformis TaxID=27350 RepID=A0A2S4USQ7_9BASI|nr:hypothetical protein PSHT_13199 [Puccinia striiformis]